MIRLGQHKPDDGMLRDLAPDLTPILDILFILLVFFMLTAGVIFQSLDLKLPTSDSQEFSLQDEPKHIVLEIRSGTYALDGKLIRNFEALKKAVPETIATKLGHELVIASDRHVTIQELLRVLIYFRSQGIETANILMKNENVK